MDRAPGLDSVVQVVEPTGADLLVTLGIGGGLVRLRTTPEIDLGPGAKVRIWPNPAKMRLFAADGGEALL
jgi:hypothetical protein